jgi:hypothetical protein
MPKHDAELAGEVLRSSRPAWLAALVALLVVAALMMAIGPLAAGATVTPSAIRSGGLLGVVSAILVCVGLGIWTSWAVERGGTAFLAPLAGGFLIKLVVLAAGTVLLWGPLRELGNHDAFALCFAACGMAFWLPFVRSLRGRGRP